MTRTYTKARTDVRKGSVISSDDIRPAGDGRQIPITALETPPPDIEVPSVAETQAPRFNLDAFMEEKVTIHIPRSNIEGELTHAEVGCNGQKCVIPRGQNVIIKRKYLEILLRGKQSNYTQRVVQADAQNIETPLDEAVGLTYPLNIIDDTMQGKRWAQDILAQPA